MVYGGHILGQVCPGHHQGYIYHKKRASKALLSLTFIQVPYPHMSEHPPRSATTRSSDRPYSRDEVVFPFEQQTSQAIHEPPIVSTVTRDHFTFGADHEYSIIMNQYLVTCRRTRKHRLKIPIYTNPRYLDQMLGEDRWLQRIKSTPSSPSTVPSINPGQDIINCRMLPKHTTTVSKQQVC